MTPLEKLKQENVSLRDRIEQLEEEIRYAQEEAGVDDDATRVFQAKAKLHWGMQPFTSKTLYLLYQRKGRLVSPETIYNIIYDGRDYEPDPKIIRIYIYKIRELLPLGDLRTVPNQGYALTASGLDRVKQLLETPDDQIVFVGARPRAPQEPVTGHFYYIKALQVLYEGGRGMTTSEITRVLKERPGDTSASMARLRAKGLIRSESRPTKGPGRAPFIHYITEAGVARLRESHLIKDEAA